MNIAFLHRKPVRMIDGPLVDTRRADVVTRMAADLVAGEAYQCESDAIVMLAFKGYRYTDIFMLVDDARQVAQQTTVAREISP